MAGVMLAGGRHIFGQPVNIGLSESGQLYMQFGQLRICQEDIQIPAISVGGATCPMLYALIFNN